MSFFFSFFTDSFLFFQRQSRRWQRDRIAFPSMANLPLVEGRFHFSQPCGNRADGFSPRSIRSIGNWSRSLLNATCRLYTAQTAQQFLLAKSTRSLTEPFDKTPIKIVSTCLKCSNNLIIFLFSSKVTSSLDIFTVRAKILILDGVADQCPILQ